MGILAPEQLAGKGTTVQSDIYALGLVLYEIFTGKPLHDSPTGRDATRAFVTGCFQEDLTPDLRGVEEMFIPVDDPEELNTLSSGERKIRREQDRRLAAARVRQQVQHWENFFRNHKKYFEVGKVVGVQPETGEPPELCQAAKQQRPKRKDMKRAAAKAGHP